MALIFVTGGAKSGKSKFAEELILSLNDGKENVYLATSLVFDEEMKEKVRLHKERRKNDWGTVEAYKNFESNLNKYFPKTENEIKNNMLVDCLTNMITNIIFEEKDVDWDNFDKKSYVKIVEKLNKNVENSVNDQGLENLPGSESVDNMPKSPGLKNLPWSSQVDFTGDQGRFYSSEGGSRVNRNARAQINLKIKDSSISQSVKSSGSVENSDGSTDGWTRNKTSKPLESATNPGNASQLTPDGAVEAPSANPARMKGPVAARQEYLPSVYHRGVDISRVRSNLVHAGIPAKQTSDNQLIFMIDLVLDRASGPVRSPNGFVTTALKNGWYELVSQAEEKSLNSAGSGALCRQHRCYLSVTGECKRCIAEQRAAELDDLHHELVWKKNLTQIDVATLEVSLRHGGYAIDSVSVQDFGQYIMAALNSGISPTNNDLFRYFADNQEIFTPDAASDKEFAGFGYERTA